ncbi:MAG: hypothetical protein CMP22_03225 [Rickettsiales bacterium]|nr:hypothetical protein [Rickettsiales bacterium]
MSPLRKNDIANYINSCFLNDEKQSNYTQSLIDVLSALDWNGSIRTLRDSIPYKTQKEALNETEFTNVLAALGYKTDIVQLRSSDLDEAVFPCLFMTEGLNKSELSILTHKPANDKKGKAYIFTKLSDVNSITTDKTIAVSGRSWFLKLFLRFKSFFAQVLLASFFINLLALITPIFMMSIYDNVIGDHSKGTLNFLLFGVVLAVIIEFILRCLRTRTISWFGARLDYVVSTNILDKLMKLPAHLTEKASVAAQLSRIKAFESVKEFFTGALALSFVELPFTIILIVAIAFIGGTLVLIPVISILIFLTILWVMHIKIKGLTKRLALVSNDRQSMSIESFIKKETLGYSGGFDAWIERFQKTNAEASYVSYKYTQSISLLDTISQGFIILSGTAMIYFGVEKIWLDELSMGALIALLILTWRSLSPIQTVCSSIPRLEQVKKNITQINRLMDLKPEFDINNISEKEPIFKGNIEFHNVGLRYTKDADPVYAGFSLRIEQGNMVAITGENSTGKSTTLKLVSGLYRPQAGSVRIDGVDIRQIDPIQLRQNIAYVSQDPDFFSMSLKDNLRLVKPNAIDNEIDTAIAQAGLEEWVNDLEDGLDTLITDYNKENIISNAIKPQFALARAYLQDSPIMLIDEMPYQFLNTAAGTKFLSVLKKIKGNKTILFITYREDYIDLADIVIKLSSDERPVIERGNQGA